MTNSSFNQLHKDFVFPERPSGSESTSLSSPRSLSPALSTASDSTSLNHNRTPSGAAVAAASFAAAAAQNSGSVHKNAESLTETIRDSQFDTYPKPNTSSAPNNFFHHGATLSGSHNTSLPSISFSAEQHSSSPNLGSNLNHIPHQKPHGSLDYFSQTLSASSSTATTPGIGSNTIPALSSSPPDNLLQENHRIASGTLMSPSVSRHSFASSPSILSQPSFHHSSNSQQFHIPRSSQHRASLTRSVSNNMPFRTSSPIVLDPKLSFENLIQLNIQLSVALKSTQEAASRLTEIVIRQNIFSRLQASLSNFSKTLAEKSKSDPSKFSNPFLQSSELISSLLKPDLHNKHSGFMSSLKSTNRSLINSFITLIKTSPSFICACISTMNEADINSLYLPLDTSSTGFEDLASLHRYNSLDIIFYSFFPPIAPIRQRHDYFSFILAFTFDNDKDKKYNGLIMAILSRIYESCDNDLSGVEEILLGMLQDGHFLSSSKFSSTVPLTVQTNPNGTYTPGISSSSSSINLTPVSATGVFSLFPSSSSPTSTHPSPELSAVSTSTAAIPTFSKPTVSPAALSLQRLNNSYKNQSHSKHQLSPSPHFTSVSQPNLQTNYPSLPFPQQSSSPGPDFEEKKQKFLTSYIIKILTHLNNTANESIPIEFKDFVSLTLYKVSESHRQQALSFIFHKFYLGKYVSRIISFPECYGLLQDFYVSETQRQRILVHVFQYLQLYADIVLLDATTSYTLHISPEIKRQLFLLYDQFKSLLDPKVNIASFSSRCTVSPESDNFDLEESFVNYPFEGGSFHGQLICLAPADIYTLYSGLFTSLINKSKPIHPSHSASNLSFSAPSNPPFYMNKSGSTLTLPNMHIAPSTSSLSEASINFDTDDDSSYDVDDSAFEWNLADIYSDIEPAAQEIYRKFPYLQFKSPSSWNYLNTMRPQKSQNFRLPHPFSEKWQLFRVNDDNTITGVDNLSAIGFNNDLKAELQAFSQTEIDFLYDEQYPLYEFEPSYPVSSTNKIYSDAVIKALRSLIADNSSALLNFQTSENGTDSFTQSFSGSFETFIHSQWYGDFTKIPSLPNTNRMIPSLPHFSQTSPYYLVEILTDAANRATSMRDYYKGCEYFNASQAMLKLLPHHTANNYHQIAYELNSSILRALKQNEETFLSKMSSMIEKCDDIAGPYQVYLQQTLSTCDLLSNQLNTFRTKIWYATEIRNGVLWSRAKEIVTSLRRGSSLLTPKFDEEDIYNNSRPHTLKRNSSTTSLSSAAAYTFKRLTGTSNKREYTNKRHSVGHIGAASFPASVGSGGSHNHSSSTLSESLFAPSEIAGENKLNDKESDRTEKWIETQGIQNLCAGEELIHRFLCEVDNLVKRIVGDLSSTHPGRGQSTFSSSVLFRNDFLKLIMEVEGIDHSSTASFSFPKQNGNTNNNSSGGGFLGGLFGSSSRLDNESEFRRRGSCESVPADLQKLTHNRSKTSGSGNGPSHAHSSTGQSEISRSYSLRGHKSRKSSPKLMDMFSSLDISGSTGGTNSRKTTTFADTKAVDPIAGADYSSNTGLTINRPHSSAAAAATSSEKVFGHRRNKSLNEGMNGNNFGYSLNQGNGNVQVSNNNYFGSNIITEEAGLNRMSQSYAPASSGFTEPSLQPSFSPVPGTNHSFQQHQSHLQSSSSSSISFTPPIPHSPSPIPFLDEMPLQRKQRQQNERRRFILKDMIFTLQMQLTSLVLTDLGVEVWAEGSETDKWIYSPLVSSSFDHQEGKSKSQMDSTASRNSTQTEPNSTFIGGSATGASSLSPRRYSINGPKLREIDLQYFLNSKLTYPAASGTFQSSNYFKRSSGINSNHHATFSFPYEEAYGNLLFRLSVSPSPMTKLITVHELVKLVVSALKMRKFNSYSNSNGNNTSKKHFDNFGVLASENNEKTPPNTTNPAAMAALNSSSSTSSIYGSLSGIPTHQDSTFNLANVSTPAPAPLSANLSNSTTSTVLNYTNATDFTVTPNANNALLRNSSNMSNIAISEKPISRRGSTSMTSLGEAIAIVEARRASSGVYASSITNSPIKLSSTNGTKKSAVTSGTVTPQNSNGFSMLNSTYISRTPTQAAAASTEDAAAIAAAAAAAAIGPNTDSIVDELCTIFKHKGYHSKTLFRDLQYIAAFIPTEILDKTDMGKAFWDVSLAALSLKEDYLDVVVNSAYDVFKICTGMIGTIPSEDADEKCRFDDAEEEGNISANRCSESAVEEEDEDSFDEEVDNEGNKLLADYKPHQTSMSLADINFYSQWTLADCFKLWTIAAREGDIDGQRELAIMYISYPELTCPVLPIFGQPNSIFPSSVLQSFKEAGSTGRATNNHSSHQHQYHYNSDKFTSTYAEYTGKAIDSVRAVLIKTWMSNAATHGDNIAIEYLSQDEQHGNNF